MRVSGEGAGGGGGLEATVDTLTFPGEVGVPGLVPGCPSTQEEAMARVQTWAEQHLLFCCGLSQSAFPPRVSCAGGARWALTQGLLRCWASGCSTTS